MSELDRLFGGPSLPSAAETFTDRQGESAAFAEAIDEHLGRLRSGSLPFDGPRSNVITFYGIGGQGKTTLSERLERWIAGRLGTDSDWGAPPEIGRPVITTRIELHEHRGFDVEQAVLRLRASIGSTKVSTRTFDHAFGLWWPAYHASDDVPSIPVRQFSFMPASGFDVAGQIKDSIVSMAENSGVAFGLPQLLLRVAGGLREGMQRRMAEAAIAADPLARPILDAVMHRPDLEALSAMPYLMSFDIHRAETDDRPLWIVFVDGFEHLNGGSARRGEADFQRMMLGLPDAMWVVTGRLRLDWEDTARLGALPRVGASHWPGLAAVAHGSQQHQVGELAVDDIHRFLGRATRALPPDYRTPEVFGWIANHSGGWPLYLDKAVKRLAQLAADGVVPTQAILDISFSDLVERITEDLPADERTALFWAAMCPRFSPALLVAASGRTVRERTIAVLRSRGLVREHAWDDFTFSLHDSLRDQLRKVSTSAGGWTPTEWRDAAADAVVELHRAYQAADTRSARLSCFALAAATALDADIPAEWLVSAGPNLPLMELASQAMPAVPADREDAWVAHLAAVLSCWRNDSSPTLRWQRLEAVLATRQMPASIRALAERFSAYSYRNHGDEHRCRAIFERLVADEAPGMKINHRQLAIARLRIGDFPGADRAIVAGEAAGVPADGVTSFRALALRRRGDLATARQLMQQRMEVLRADRRFRLEDEYTTDFLEVDALGPTPDVDEIERVGRRFVESGNTRRIIAVRFAGALAKAGGPGFADAQQAVDEAFRLPPPGGDAEHELPYRQHVPPVFDAAVRGDRDAAAALAGKVDGHILWQAITRFWTSVDDPDAVDGTGVDWGEAPGLAMRRWHSVVLTRRAALVANPSQ